MIPNCRFMSSRQLHSDGYRCTKMSTNVLGYIMSLCHYSEMNHSVMSPPSHDFLKPYITFIFLDKIRQNLRGLASLSKLLSHLHIPSSLLCTPNPFGC